MMFGCGDVISILEYSIYQEGCAEIDENESIQ